MSAATLIAPEVLLLLVWSPPAVEVRETREAPSTSKSATSEGWLKYKSPTTVAAGRYGGWYAFPLEREQVPAWVNSNDGDHAANRGMEQHKLPFSLLA